MVPGYALEILVKPTKISAIKAVTCKDNKSIRPWNMLK